MPQHHFRQHHHHREQIRHHHELAHRDYRDHAGNEKRYEWADFFVYATDPLGFSLTSGQQLNRVIQLDADSDFNVMRMTGYAEPNGATFPLADNIMPQISVLLVDGMTSRNLFNNPLAWGAIIGTGKLPLVLPQYRVFARNGTIILQLANFSSVTYNNIQIALEGVKLFEKGRS